MAKSPGIIVAVGPKTLSFRTASELRDALLASFDGADHFGGKPWVALNPVDHEYAWGWFGRLLARRSDWREAAGAALAAAVEKGGSLAEVAFADLMANARSMATIRDVAQAVAAQHGDVRATYSLTAMGGRSPTPALKHIAKDQAKYKLIDKQSRWRVLLYEYGDELTPRVEDVQDVVALRALLAETALDGRSVASAYGAGPWGWLYEEVLFRPWVHDALPALLDDLTSTVPETVPAALDWLTAEWDLWRHEALFSKWLVASPPWLTERVDAKRDGWTRAMTLKGREGVDTLGDLVAHLSAAAEAQAATKPVMDL